VSVRGRTDAEAIRIGSPRAARQREALAR